MKKLCFILALLASPAIFFAQEVTNKEGVFVGNNGEKYSGNLVSYFENGNKEYVYEIKNGIQHGKAEFFYSSGKLMESGMFANGLKAGKWTKWSEKGLKLAEANYTNGEKDGTWVIWDENGVKRYEMLYNKGQRAGAWKSWDETGKEGETKVYTSN
jgi:antitoxin component YwqK of YwqJK toxin-antitoxin module